MDVSIPALLETVEPLIHSQRVKHMILIGQNSRTAPDIRGVIESLVSGEEVYEQFLGLESCYGFYNQDVIQKCLGSNSKKLKSRALDLLVLHGEDAEILEVLKELPETLLVKVVKKLRNSRSKRKRIGVIEEFLKFLEDKGDEEALFRRLLSLGGRSFVESHLPAQIANFGVIEWNSLVKYHPEITGIEVKEKVLRAEDGEAFIVDLVGRVLGQWLAHIQTVHFAFDLVRNLEGNISVNDLPIVELISKRPTETVQIILDSKDDLSITTLDDLEASVLKRLSLEQFQSLFTRYPGIIDKWEFPGLSPSQRLFVYQSRHLVPITTSSNKWTDDKGFLDTIIFDALPLKEKISEARRHLKLKAFDTKPEEKIPYIASLPWEEGMVLQMPFIKSSDPAIRATALKEQIQSAKYSSDKVPDALKLILERKNEQDPVKKEMITALGELPMGAWKESHFDDFAQIVRNIMGAADTSSSTIHRLLHLIMKVLIAHPKFAAEQLAFILKDRKEVPGRYYLSGIHPVKEIMAIIENKLSPYLQGLIRKKDATALMNLALGFRYSGHSQYWPELLDACQSILEDPDMGEHHYWMFILLQDGRPRTWPSLIPSLLERNPSLAGNEHVLNNINFHQQNLLHFYLDEDAARNYANEALCLLSQGFWRWTATQQDLFAQMLVKEIKDADTSTEDKARYIKQLSSLPFIKESYTTQFANDSNPVVMETAIKAVGRMDSDLTFPTLLQALSDERARTAIYALRSHLKTLPKSEVFPILTTIPLVKVTVAKETLRMIGELGTEEAFQYLLRREKEELHADVRKALFRALWAFLNREESWVVFWKAAQDPDVSTAKTVIAIPDDGMSPAAREQLLKLYWRLLKHPSPEVLLAVVSYLEYSPPQDKEGLLAPEFLKLIRSENEEISAAAAKVMLKLYAKSHVSLISELYYDMLKDRKTLRRVHEIYVDEVLSPDVKKNFHLVTHAILSVLKTDRLSISKTVKLIFNGLFWDEIQQHLIGIVEDLHADALVETEGFIQENLNSWKKTTDDTLDFESKLACSQDEKARRLALSFLIGEVGIEGAWSEDQKARLEVYRNDDSILVAEAAWDVEVRDIDEEEEDVYDTETSE